MPTAQQEPIFFGLQWEISWMYLIMYRSLSKGKNVQNVVSTLADDRCPSNSHTSKYLKASATTKEQVYWKIHNSLKV